MVMAAAREENGEFCIAVERYVYYSTDLVG